MEWAILVAGTVSVFACCATVITVRALSLAEAMEPEAEFDSEDEANKALLRQADGLEETAAALDEDWQATAAKERWEAAREIRESVKAK